MNVSRVRRNDAPQSTRSSLLKRSTVVSFATCGRHGRVLCLAALVLRLRFLLITRSSFTRLVLLVLQDGDFEELRVLDAHAAEGQVPLEYL